MKSILKQYHYLYKITNLINNKIYIGIHSTNKLDDGYFGSSSTLKSSIDKHSKENFKKEILEWFDWRIEALLKEAEIVNDDFIKRHDTYNLIHGGNCCIVQYDKHNERNPMFGRRHSELSKIKNRVSHLNNTYRIGTHHTEQSKSILSDRSKSFYELHGSKSVKPCKINDRIFKSLNDAYKNLKDEFNVNSISTFKRRINDTSCMFEFIEVKNG